jgi:HK97 family phage major capsid protein
VSQILIDTTSKATLKSSMEAALAASESKRKELSDKVALFATQHAEVIERLGKADGDRDEQVKALRDLKVLVGDMNRTPTLDGKKRRIPVSKEAFLQYGMQAIHQAKSVVKSTVHPWGTTFETDEDDVFEQWKTAGDDVRLTAMLMGIKDLGRIEQLKIFRGPYLDACKAVEPILKEAFDTGDAGAGLEWLAQDMSEQLIEMIRIERVLAAYFQEVPMRHGSLRFPTWLTDLQAFLMTENTGDSDTPAIGDGLNTRDITSKYDLAAKAVGVAIKMSKFLVEDAAIEELPWARHAIVETLGEAEEEMILNGDTTATHMDTDINAVTDHPAKAFPGLRYVATRSVNPARVAAGGARLDSDASIRDFLLKVLGRMDKYGTSPGKVLCLSGAIGNSQLLSVQAWLTAYAASQAATNVSGKVPPTPFGWKYAVSGKQRANLDSSGVNSSGTTALDRTSTELVYLPAWKIGKVREVTLQVLDQTRAKQDQIEILGTMREAFGSPYKTDGTEPHVGQVYDQGV